ncbi:hypothetical protein MG293_020650 [Ovis ammon polii]|uniref:Uncharacterized protein n=2 Tax=Ovis TaxID=9935 RepID=A0A835ZLV2_SHEEP|nr:hypothetical protein JEQ12_012900 [Ovis aries]KAI4529402.1 hypothetical protein MG293_020650 [Ovis ammon polii]
MLRRMAFKASDCLDRQCHEEKQFCIFGTTQLVRQDSLKNATTHKSCHLLGIRTTSFKQPSTTSHSASKEKAMDGPHKPSLTQASCSLSCIPGSDCRKWPLRLHGGGASTSSAVATCQSDSAGRLRTDEEQVY